MDPHSTPGFMAQLEGECEGDSQTICLPHECGWCEEKCPECAENSAFSASVASNGKLGRGGSRRSRK